jgi:hypothetical protein
MRGIGGFLAVGAVLLGASGCAPMLNGLSFNPGCSSMQARAYHTTSQFTSKQRVSAVQARYSLQARSYPGPIRQAEGWKSLSSGECR